MNHLTDGFQLIEGLLHHVWLETIHGMISRCLWQILEDEVFEGKARKNRVKFDCTIALYMGARFTLASLDDQTIDQVKGAVERDCDDSVIMRWRYSGSNLVPEFLGDSLIAGGSVEMSFCLRIHPPVSIFCASAGR